MFSRATLVRYLLRTVLHCQTVHSIVSNHATCWLTMSQKEVRLQSSKMTAGLLTLTKSASLNLLTSEPRIFVPHWRAEPRLKEYDRAWIFAAFSSNSEMLAVTRLHRSALIFQIGSRPHVVSLALHGDPVDIGFNSQHHLIACLLVPSKDPAQAPDRLRSSMLALSDLYDRKRKALILNSCNMQPPSFSNCSKMTNFSQIPGFGRGANCTALFFRRVILRS